MRSILSALVGIILLFSMARAAGNEINRTAVIVTDEDSVSINLNRNFEDCGVDKYLVEYVEGYNPAAAITIGVNTCYTEHLNITPYTGDVESLEIGADITGMMSEQSPITVNYTIYVIDYSIIQDADITDGTTIDKEGGALLTLGGYTDDNLLNAISEADNLSWYYHTEDIGSGITKPAIIYTGKNKFTLKLEDPSYKDAVSKLNGDAFEGSSGSTHYVILDNPEEFYEPDVGNYNFEITYKDNYLVEGSRPGIGGGVYVSNEKFLVHKPKFELDLEFIDRSEEGNIGANKNPLDFSWEVLNNGGSIEVNKYKNSDGVFYSNPTRIKLNIKSDGTELKPVILTIHPFKPVISSNASVDNDKNRTLRVTNVRDIRWANVANGAYSTSNIMDKTGALLSVPLGYTNPKYGYGIGLALDTINENLGKAENLTVNVSFEPTTPMNIINNTPLEDKYKKIIINLGSSGQQENFMEKRTDGINDSSIWSFMYYLPSKKDPSVGNQVEVYFDDIIIEYPNGSVKYSDWFGENIHIFTYDNTIDVIDDIEDQVAY